MTWITKVTQKQTSQQTECSDDLEEPVHGLLRTKMVSNDCSISLYTTDILLRYKSEWDPRAHAHTKGGYLDGEIRVPRVSHKQRVML